MSDSCLLCRRALLRGNSFCRLLNVARERWDLCSAAAAMRGDGDRDTLLSFDSGRGPRPLAVYLQNLLCPLLGVTVRYPFAQESFQRELWRSHSHLRYVGASSFTSFTGVLSRPLLDSNHHLEQSVSILRGFAVCELSSKRVSRQFDSVSYTI